MKLCIKKPDRRGWVMIILWILTAATLCFIFSNSIASREESGAASHGLSAFLQSIIDPNQKIDPDIFHTFVRKLAHFAEFFILGVELALIRRVTFGKIFGVGYFTVAFSLLAVANIDEFIQSFTGRGSQVSDSLIDFSGGITGTLAVAFTYWLILKLAKRRRLKASLAPKKTRGGKRSKRLQA